ncbi:hypothetical protein ACJJTC_014083 [Scirpophaga incertulas]
MLATFTSKLVITPHPHLLMLLHAQLVVTIIRSKLSSYIRHGKVRFSYLAPKGGKCQTKSAADKPTANEPRSLPPPSFNTEDVWSTVVKCGQRRRQGMARQLLVNTTTPKQPPPAPPLQPKSRVSKAAAVVITLQPGAEEKSHTYGKILADAREKINLVELDIEGVRYRRALTGAAVFLAGNNREGVCAWPCQRPQIWCRSGSRMGIDTR